MEQLIEGLEEEIVKRIKKARDKDEKVMEEIKKAEVKTLRDKEWQIEEELVLKEGCMFQRMRS